MTLLIGIDFSGSRRIHTFAEKLKLSNFILRQRERAYRDGGRLLACLSPAGQVLSELGGGRSGGEPQIPRFFCSLVLRLLRCSFHGTYLFNNRIPSRV